MCSPLAQARSSVSHGWWLMASVMNLLRRLSGMLDSTCTSSAQCNESLLKQGNKTANTAPMRRPRSVTLTCAHGRLGVMRLHPHMGSALQP